MKRSLNWDVKMSHTNFVNEVSDLTVSRSSEPDPFGCPNGSRPIAEEATKPRVSRNKTDKSRRRSWKGFVFFCTRTFFYGSALRSLEHPLNGGLIYQVILFPSPF